MRTNFYDTRVEGLRTFPVKQKAVNYKTDKFCRPVLVVELMIK